MNEFEWQRRLRQLDRPLEPQRDLWPSIAERLLAAQLPVRRTHWPRFAAIAASLVLGLGAVLLATQWRQPHEELVRLERAPSAASTPRFADQAGAGTALAWAQPDDPQLAGAALELDAATAAIEHALERDPQAVFLVGLLNRTYERRVRLMQMSARAG